MNLPYGPATELLGIYLREMKTYFHTETCMNGRKNFIHDSQKLRTI